MRRLYLTLDDRLFERIQEAAEKKGIPATSVVVNNLEDLYLKKDGVDYDEILATLYEEAKRQPPNVPFLLGELPSFAELIIASADKAHVSPATIRARVGKCFNSAVRNKKLDAIERAKKLDGSLLNRAGVALYIHKAEPCHK